jgi:hypothetical protein
MARDFAKAEQLHHREVVEDEAGVCPALAPEIDAVEQADQFDAALVAHLFGAREPLGR